MRRKDLSKSSKRIEANAINLKSMSAAVILSSALITSGISYAYAEESVDVSTNANSESVASVKATNDLQTAKANAREELDRLYQKALEGLNINIQVETLPVDKAKNLITKEYNQLTSQIDTASGSDDVARIVDDAKVKLDAKRAMNIILEETISTEIIPTLDPELEKLREAAITAIHEKAKEVDIVINENNGKYISQRQWTFYHDEVARLTDDHNGSIIYKITISTSKGEINSLKSDAIGELENLKYTIERRIQIMQPLFLRMSAVYGGYISEIKTLPYLDKEEAAKLNELLELELQNAQNAIIDTDDAHLKDAKIYVEEFEKKLNEIVLPYRKLNLMRTPYINRLIAAKDAKDEALIALKKDPRFLADFAESDIRSVYSSAYLDIAHAKDEEEAGRILMTALGKFDQIYNNIQRRRIRIEELDTLYKVMYRDIDGMNWLISRGEILEKLEQTTKKALDEIDEITNADEVGEVADKLKEEIDNIFKEAQEESESLSSTVSNLIDEANETKEKLDNLKGFNPEVIDTYKELVDSLIEPLESENAPADLNEILDATKDELEDILHEAQVKSNAVVKLDDIASKAEDEIENLPNISKPTKLKTKSKIKRNFNKLKNNVPNLDEGKLNESVANAAAEIESLLSDAKDLDSKIETAQKNTDNSADKALENVDALGNLSEEEKEDLKNKLEDIKDKTDESLKEAEIPADIDPIVQGHDEKISEVVEGAKELNGDKGDILNDLFESVSNAKDMLEALENLSGDEKESFNSEIDNASDDVEEKVTSTPKDAFAEKVENAKNEIDSILLKAASLDEKNHEELEKSAEESKDENVESPKDDLSGEEIKEEVPETEVEEKDDSTIEEPFIPVDEKMPSEVDPSEDTSTEETKKPGEAEVTPETSEEAKEEVIPEPEQPSVEIPEIEVPEVEEPEAEVLPAEKDDVEQPEDTKPEEVEIPEVDKKPAEETTTPEVEEVAPEIDNPEVDETEKDTADQDKPGVEIPESIEDTKDEVTPEPEQPTIEVPEVEEKHSVEEPDTEVLPAEKDDIVEPEDPKSDEIETPELDKEAEEETTIPGLEEVVPETDKPEVVEQEKDTAEQEKPGVEIPESSEDTKDEVTPDPEQSTVDVPEVEEKPSVEEPEAEVLPAEKDDIVVPEDSKSDKVDTPKSDDKETVSSEGHQENEEVSDVEKPASAVKDESTQTTEKVVRSRRLPKTADSKTNVEMGLFSLSLSIIALMGARSRKKQ